MAKSTPTVRRDRLYLADGKTISLADFDEWQAWLVSAKTFRFEGQGGTFTARSDGRKFGGEYWSAFRRKYNRNFRAYLGKSEALNVGVLEDAAASIQADIAQHIQRKK